MRVILQSDNPSTYVSMVNHARALGGKLKDNGAEQAECQIDESGFKALLKQYGPHCVRDADAIKLCWQSFYQLCVPYTYNNGKAVCAAELVIGGKRVKGQVTIAFGADGNAEDIDFHAD